MSRLLPVPPFLPSGFRLAIAEGAIPRLPERVFRAAGPNLERNKIRTIFLEVKRHGHKTSCLDVDHSMVHIFAMRISVTAAKGQLTELVRRAEAGEEVLLTRHGQTAVKLVPVKAKPTAEEKGAILAAIRKRASRKAKPGPSAARSQDFLYDENGLPK